MNDWIGIVMVLIATSACGFLIGYYFGAYHGGNKKNM